MKLLPRLLLLLAWAMLLPSCRRTPEPPEILGTLTDFELKTDTGVPFTRAAFDGGDSVVAFFFTRCPTVCPRLVASLQQLEKELGPKAPRFVLFSVDPEYDTPEVLRAFRTKHGLGARFTLATGRYEELARVVEQGFKVGLGGRADATKEHFGISHGSHFVHVGPGGAILGYYRGQDPEKLRQLAEVLRP